MFTPEQLEYVLIGLIIGITILIFVTILQAVRLSKIQKNQNKLMRGMKEENLEEILLKYIDRVDHFGERLLGCEQEIKDLRLLLKAKAANIRMIRYNAYEESGNDLSFTIAVLNDNKEGFVITSLYNRHDQRVYAKPIIKGESRYPLTDEEQEVLAKLTK
ncbi:DUF4446 family protein [Desulfuribacillus alkaliarsenatis]|uniref:DUF4446 domain-containing protein n=1 Tax=Desulfuribacillus alkaliarsenatis TaxID=766136 RepID=A0A1E5G2K9_9FIRM|nr:DUF4446 family protein [Desulfuribacillus alkaliarsenatis]OEF97325.1 hypothetical protein BHF68_03680 [Desulfuribacillus alkaliarsenatis]